MLSSFVRGARPLQRVLFFVMFSIVVGGVVSLLSVSLLKMLYGISLPQDYGLLQDLSKPWVVGANKLLLLMQHVGFFVVPGLVFFLLISGSWQMQWPSNTKKWVLMVVLGIAIYPVIGLLAYLNELIPMSESLVAMEDSAGELTMAIVKSDSIGVLLWNLVVVAVLPAVGEELVFRGIIQQELERQYSKPWLAIVLSALVFSTLHMQFAGFIPRFALGVLLGYVFYRTRNIWVPIILHFTNNAFALILVFIAQPQEASLAEFEAFEFDALTIGSLLVGTIVAVLVMRHYLHALSPEPESIEVASMVRVEDEEDTEE